MFCVYEEFPMQIFVIVKSVYANKFIQHTF